ncbi:MAG: hypothetical protein LCH54_04945 [Bacteroidetes bacterium]|nr:hypothetical protein [Bacteroidota bacterium]
MTNRSFLWFIGFFSILIVFYWLFDYANSKQHLTAALVEKTLSIHRLIGPELEFSAKIREEFMDERRTRIEGSADIISQMVLNGRLSDKALDRISEINHFSHIFIWNQNKKLIHFHQSSDYEFPDSLNAAILSQANDLIEKNNSGFIELFNVVDTNLVFLGYTGVLSGFQRILILSDARYRENLLRNLGFQRLIENFSNDQAVSFIRVNDGLSDIAGFGTETQGVLIKNLSVYSPVGYSLWISNDSTGNWLIKSKEQVSVGDKTLTIFTGIVANELGDLPSLVLIKGVSTLLGAWLIMGLGLLYFESRKKYFSTIDEREFIRHQSESMIEGLPEGLLVLSDASKVLVVNRKIELWFSVKRKDIFGKTVSEFPDHLKKVISSMEINNLTNFQIPDSPGFDRELVVSRTFYPGNPAFYVFIFTDVTDFQKLQTEMDNRKRLSELGTLSAGLAHEIRNPINTLGLILQRIRAENENLNPDVQPMLSAGLSEINRINRLIEEILTFARSRASAKVQLGIDDLISRLKNRLEVQIRETGVIFETDLSQTSLSVFTDPLKLLQILENLILNAVTVSSPGSLVALRVRSDEKIVKFYICDSGPGIPKENRDQIFYPFFTTRQDGTGLGLFLVNQYANQTGIKVSLTSVLGKGTIFTLTLRKQEH